jgi:uncharacterized membrane protein
MRAQVFIAVVLTLIATRQTAAQRIETEIIGSFAGHQLTIPTGINNRGDIAGVVLPTGTLAGTDAFLWTREAGFQLLAEDAVATDLNNRGDVAGYRFECESDPGGGGSCSLRGFVWNVGTGFTDLGNFVPMAINNSGDMAGECSTGETLAACAMHGGVLTQWECEADSCGQVARGINARGDVVGYRFSPDFEDAMLFPRHGAPVVLGAQTAEDINNAGTIAGRAPTDLWPSNATLWTRKGLLQAPSADTTVAWALNARGWAAGVRFGEGNAAFFWDGVSRSLLFLAPQAVSSEATDINDRGEIVGAIGTPAGVQQMVIWRVRP